MATEMFTRDGRHVATRFFGGRAAGVVVQMEVTESEFREFARHEVVDCTGWCGGTFAEWVAAQNATVRWDNAARQNERARQFEESRFAEFFVAAAAEARVRARFCARDAMRVV